MELARLLSVMNEGASVTQGVSSPFRPSFPCEDSTTRAVKGCKTTGCLVCLKGPPPTFDKGTPIWYPD